LKTLFILKRREDFDPVTHTNIRLSTGLYNSAEFVHKMLLENGIDSKIVVCPDNNYIDKEVHDFRPDLVFIEALWVVPEKFEILRKLHPKVKWVIRIHSDIPFMAQEGIAMGWIFDYVSQNNMIVAPNSPKMVNDIQVVADAIYGKDKKKIVYLPNYYPVSVLAPPKKIDPNKDTINISSFGAIRPLKNQLIQAFAAIDFAVQRGLKLHFHLNSGRIEGGGNPCDSNLHSLFEHLDPKRFEVTFHKWLTHENFIELIKTMDIGMQVSFSETFNIVGADHVVNGVPFLGCEEIPWWGNVPVSTTDRPKIVQLLNGIYESSEANILVNQINLTKYAGTSQTRWLEFLKGQ
jgi:glycosyltransferase involved in cell wall biosynthesis